jgi:sugar diacid utilization regulator
MTLTKDMPDRAVLVAIDIAKHRNEILIEIRQRDKSFRSKFERYIARDRDNPDLRRKALSAIAAKMARTAHAVVKRGEDYRPFFEGTVPGGRTPL